VQLTNSSGSVVPCRRRSSISARPASRRGIGAELSFSGRRRQGAASAFPDSNMTDALFVLERMRSIKTPDELKKLKTRRRR